MSAATAIRSGMTDLYPSRQGLPERRMARQDPVIHAGSATPRPAFLSAAQCAQYARDGFLVLDGLFADAEVAAWQAELTALRNDPGVRERAEAVTEPDTGALRSLFAIHRINPVFARLAADARLLAMARYILNDELYIHQSRLNYKPGFRGQEFYWHSDFETWHVEDGMPRMRAVSLSVALTDNDARNGALMLIPGSHRDYISCSGSTPPDNYRRSLRRQQCGVPSEAHLAAAAREHGIVTASVRAGSVIAFDCNTLHGSNGNITPYPRSNAFFVYNAVSNALQDPFCAQPPRPEYIATRGNIRPLATGPDHEGR